MMIGCDRFYVQIQRVQNSCTRRILRLNLTSLAYADMARNTEIERSSVNHIEDMINIVMFTIENYSISRGDRTWFSLFGSCDHLDD